MSYFVQHGGQQLGPFTEAELKAQLASGAISATDYVWWEGQTEWLVLGQTPLAAASPVPASPMPPAAPPVVGQPMPGMVAPTSQLAIWALVCGCVSLFCWLFVSIPAVVIGHMALKDLKKNPAQQGRGMAIAGLVLGYITLALGLLYLCLFGFGVVMAIMQGNHS